MSLLSDIRDSAVDGNTPVATMLRKCALLAAKLGNDDLGTWVRRELNGYPADVGLPEYRILPAPAIGQLAGPFGSGFQNITIPASAMPEGFEDYARSARMREPISVIESLAEGSESGQIVSRWSGDLIALTQEKGGFASGFVLYHAHQVLSRAMLVGLIDTVRNRVMDFTLQLEADAPEAGESPSPSRRANEVVQQFVTNVYGNVGNFASASPAAVQTIAQVPQGDLTALSEALKRLGIPDGEVRALETVLKEENSTGTIGPKTSSWMSKATQAVASGAWKVGSDVTGQVVVKLLTSYLGL